MSPANQSANINCDKFAVSASMLKASFPPLFPSSFFLFSWREGEGITQLQFLKSSCMQRGFEIIFSRQCSLPAKLPSLLTTGVSSRLSLWRKQSCRELQIFDRDDNREPANTLAPNVKSVKANASGIHISRLVVLKKIGRRTFKQ